MSRFAVLFLILIGFCYSDSQDSVFYLAHKKGFLQCYKNIFQWANKYKDKYDSAASGPFHESTEITSKSNSGIVQIFLPVQCGTYLDPYKSEEYNLILTSRTDSLKIELQFELGKDYSSCIDKIKSNWVSIKQEITQLISSLPDSNIVIQTANHDTLKSHLPDSNITICTTNKDTLTSHQYSWNQIHPTNNNVLTSPSDKSTIKNTPSKGRNFFGVLTIFGGVVAGAITVADANGSESVTTVGLNSKGKQETTTTTVDHKWTVGHTIYITLSITAITAGISLLCR